MAISNFMTVIGLVNGMIGGVILVLPLLALKTGWLLIFPITVFSGFASYFTCLLCIRHLRNFKNLDAAIYHHFGKKVQYKIFYDVIIIVSMTTLLVLYFSLICEQWGGIFGESKLIPILNAMVLFPIVYVMKKYDFGATLLAYGILSIVGYVLFLIWFALSTQEGPRQIPAAHGDFVDFAAALAQGFAIQTFFIPILKKNPNQKQYKKLLGLTYVIGTIIYTFIAYSGAYSIVNRIPYIDPQTIEDYFGSGSNWQVILLEIIYLVHLYSAFPEFLLIAKERFFSIFKWPQPRDVSIKQVMYVGVTIFLCLLIKLTSMKVRVIIVLNGSIISFFFIYVVPIGLHIKCVYFTSLQDRHLMLNEQKERQNSQVNVNQQQQIGQSSGQQKNKQELEIHEMELNVVQIQPGDMRGNNSRQMGNADDTSQQQQQKQMGVIIVDVGITTNINTNTDPTQKKTQETQHAQTTIAQQQQQQQLCEQCDIRFSSQFHEYAQLSFLGIMLITGLLIMGYTLYLMVAGEVDQ